MVDTCKHCGGDRATRNPTGSCDHLYWPDNLTDEAKRANGLVPVLKTVWVEPVDVKTVDETLANQ